MASKSHVVRPKFLTRDPQILWKKCFDHNVSSLTACSHHKLNQNKESTGVGLITNSEIQDEPRQNAIPSKGLFPTLSPDKSKTKGPDQVLPFVSVDNDDDNHHSHCGSNTSHHQSWKTSTKDTRKPIVGLGQNKPHIQVPSLQDVYSKSVPAPSNTCMDVQKCYVQKGEKEQDLMIDHLNEEKHMTKKKDRKKKMRDEMSHVVSNEKDSACQGMDGDCPIIRNQDNCSDTDIPSLTYDTEQRCNVTQRCDVKQRHSAQNMKPQLKESEMYTKLLKDKNRQQHKLGHTDKIRKKSSKRSRFTHASTAKLEYLEKSGDMQGNYVMDGACRDLKRQIKCSLPSGLSDSDAFDCPITSTDTHIKPTNSAHDISQTLSFKLSGSEKGTHADSVRLVDEINTLDLDCIALNWEEHGDAFLEETSSGVNLPTRMPRYKDHTSKTTKTSNDDLGQKYNNQKLENLKKMSLTREGKNTFARNADYDQIDESVPYNSEEMINELGQKVCVEEDTSISKPNICAVVTPREKDVMANVLEGNNTQDCPTKDAHSPINTLDNAPSFGNITFDTRRDDHTAHTIRGQSVPSIAASLKIGFDDNVISHTSRIIENAIETKYKKDHKTPSFLQNQCSEILQSDDIGFSLDTDTRDEKRKCPDMLKDADNVDKIRNERINEMEAQIGIHMDAIDERQSVHQTNQTTLIKSDESQAINIGSSVGRETSSDSEYTCKDRSVHQSSITLDSIVSPPPDAGAIINGNPYEENGSAGITRRKSSNVLEVADLENGRANTISGTFSETGAPNKLSESETLYGEVSVQRGEDTEIGTGRRQYDIAEDDVKVHNTHSSPDNSFLEKLILQSQNTDDDFSFDDFDFEEQCSVGELMWCQGNDFDVERGRRHAGNDATTRYNGHATAMTFQTWTASETNERTQRNETIAIGFDDISDIPCSIENISENDFEKDNKAHSFSKVFQCDDIGFHLETETHNEAEEYPVDVTLWDDVEKGSSVGHIDDDAMTTSTSDMNAMKTEIIHLSETCDLSEQKKMRKVSQTPLLLGDTLLRTDAVQDDTVVKLDEQSTSSTPHIDNIGVQPSSGLPHDSTQIYDYKNVNYEILDTMRQCQSSSVTKSVNYFLKPLKETFLSLTKKQPMASGVGDHIEYYQRMESTTDACDTSIEWENNGDTDILFETVGFQGGEHRKDHHACDSESMEDMMESGLLFDTKCTQNNQTLSNYFHDNQNTDLGGCADIITDTALENGDQFYQDRASDIRSRPNQVSSFTTESERIESEGSVGLSEDCQQSRTLQVQSCGNEWKHLACEDLRRSSIECLLEQLVQRGKITEAFVMDLDGEVKARSNNLSMSDRSARRFYIALEAHYNGLVRIRTTKKDDNDCEEEEDGDDNDEGVVSFLCFKTFGDSMMVGTHQNWVSVSKRGDNSVVLGFARSGSPGSCIAEMNELSRVLNGRGL